MTEEQAGLRGESPHGQAAGRVPAKLASPSFRAIAQNTVAQSHVGSSKRTAPAPQGPSPRLARHIDSLTARLDSKARGASIEGIISAWSIEVFSDPTLIPELVRWMDSTEGARFLLQRGGRVHVVQEIRKQVKGSAEQFTKTLEDTWYHLDEPIGGNRTGKPLSAPLLEWDARHPHDAPLVFDFAYAPMTSEKDRFMAQLQARVLVKSSMFIIACEGNGPPIAKVIQFREAILGGRRVVEAIYLSGQTEDDEDYPNLEPWIVVLDHSVLFVGLAGLEASHAGAQLFFPLELLNRSRLDGVHAFQVDMFQGEPVISMYVPVNTEAGGSSWHDCCIGARSAKALEAYIEELGIQAELDLFG